MPLQGFAPTAGAVTTGRKQRVRHYRHGHAECRRGKCVVLLHTNGDIMKFAKVALASATLAACVLTAAPAIARDNSDVVGTWFGYSDISAPTKSQGTYYTTIWQFHADGTLIQTDTAFGGVMAINGKDPMGTGLSTAYYGGWTRNKDGTVSLFGLHYETDTAMQGVPGRVNSLVKFHDNFDPKSGVLYHCLQRIQIKDGLFDPAKDLPSQLPAGGDCPGPNPRFVIKTQMEKLK
jgi:hypothetical protein